MTVYSCKVYIVKCFLAVIWLPCTTIPYKIIQLEIDSRSLYKFCHFCYIFCVIYTSQQSFLLMSSASIWGELVRNCRDQDLKLINQLHKILKQQLRPPRNRMRVSYPWGNEDSIKLPSLSISWCFLTSLNCRSNSSHASHSVNLIL